MAFAAKLGGDPRPDGEVADTIRKTEMMLLHALGLPRLPDRVRRALLMSQVGEGGDREQGQLLISAILGPINERAEAGLSGYAQSQGPPTTYGEDIAKAAYR